MKVMGFVVSFALCGLFLFSMLSFGVGVQDSYNVSEGLLSNAGINETYNDLSTGLGGIEDSASAQRNATSGTDQITPSFGSFLLNGIGSTITIFTGMPLMIYNIVVKGTATTLGIPNIVVSLLTAFMLILIVLMLWRVIRTGE